MRSSICVIWEVRYVWHEKCDMCDMRSVICVIWEVWSFKHLDPPPPQTSSRVAPLPTECSSSSTVGVWPDDTPIRRFSSHFGPENSPSNSNSDLNSKWWCTAVDLAASRRWSKEGGVIACGHLWPEEEQFGWSFWFLLFVVLLDQVCWLFLVVSQAVGGCTSLGFLP